MAGVDVASSRVMPPTLVEKKREKWVTKVERLRKSSALSATAGWHLSSFFVKSNDDLRQEVSMRTTPSLAVIMRRWPVSDPDPDPDPDQVFIMQMTRYFQTIWPSSSLWLKFYHILATGPDTGLIETIRGSADLDRLKKTPGYTTLRNLLIERHGAEGSAGFLAAQQNFCRSLAAYSVLMRILALRALMAP